MKQLTTMRLIITNACPLACSHCSVSAGPTRNGVMPYEAARKLVTDFASLGGTKLVITGGEPLTHPDCTNILKESKHQGVRNSIYSMAIDISGGPICQSTADEFAQLIDEWFISIHSSKAESHDAMTNNIGSLERTLTGAAALSRAGIRVNANLVVHPGNVDEIPDVARLCESHEIGELRILAVVPQGRAANHGSWSIQEGKVCDAMEKAQKQSNVVIRLGDASKALFKQPNGCMAIQQEIVINWEGWVSPCHAWEPRPSNSILDNAIETSLRESLIYSPRLNRCRLETQKREYEGCLNGCLARESLIPTDTTLKALSLIQ